MDFVFLGFNLYAWITILTVLSMFTVLLLTKLRADLVFLLINSLSINFRTNIGKRAVSGIAGITLEAYLLSWAADNCFYPSFNFFVIKFFINFIGNFVTRNYTDTQRTQSSNRIRDIFTYFIQNFFYSFCFIRKFWHNFFPPSQTLD